MAVEQFQNTTSLSAFLESLNNVTEGGLGAGILLTVFVVSFYRLSGQGFLSAYIASSFTTGILSFLLAAINLLPPEIPFLVAAASLAGLAYMYILGRV